MKKFFVILMVLFMPLIVFAELPVENVAATDNQSAGLGFEVGINPGFYFYSDALGYRVSVNGRFFDKNGGLEFGLRIGVVASSLDTFNFLAYEMGAELGFVIKPSQNIRIIPLIIAGGSLGEAPDVIINPAVLFDFSIASGLNMGLEAGYRLPFVFVGTTTLFMPTPYVNISFNYQLF